ncbi:MAG: hypothetical protein QOH81_1968 [Sphingomonadales bacterium]|jgi:nucleotide-binding universal stress UspA family protein|nr:hypothetical protein [Sphingomonadales bacterium]
MKSLLLNINPDAGHDTRLATAIALVKGRGCHITCLQCLPPPVAGSDPGIGFTIVDLMEAEQKTAAEFQEEVEVRLDQAGVRWSWVRLFADAGPAIASYSRLADVILLSARDSAPTVGEVATHTRVPVLALPPEDPGLAAESPILIAWNGSHPAAHAMRSALPLLRTAGSVQILVVDRDDDEFPAARAYEYLSYHTIKADIHWRRGDGRPVAETIRAFAHELGTGLIVAGAFGHNRIRELLLGSVTRALLRKSALPLLLAH